SAIENHPERTSLRVGENAWLRSVRLDLHDPAVFKTSVNPALRVERDIFRFMTIADGKLFNRRETCVLFVLSSECWSGWRRPGGRRDRYWGEQEISECGPDDEDHDRGEEFVSSYRFNHKRHKKEFKREGFEYQNF